MSSDRSQQRLSSLAGRRATALVLGLAVCLLHPAYADDKADAAFAQYKAALASRDMERAASLICEAARLDAKKYEKKCDSTQKQVAGQLAQFDQNIATGRAAFQNRDYTGALRDLNKIAYGPHREEALSLIQQSNDQLTHSPNSLDASTEALKVAETAYAAGDFTAATAAANRVKAASIQPFAQQVLQNIRTYNDTIQQGDAMMASGNYAAAQSKYQFALHIKDNGPGDPTGKLKQIATLVAQKQPPKKEIDSAGRNPVPPPPNVKGRQPLAVVPPPPPPPDPAVLIKRALAEAHDAESKEKLDIASAAYDRVLQLDAKNAEALAGKQRVADELKKDPQALEATLVNGIRNYYKSDFTKAEGAITLYLADGGKRSKGAAHFYLGASYMARALLADQRSRTAAASLQQSAAQEFKLARQENYKPVEAYVSSRILAAWAQTS